MDERLSGEEALGLVSSQIACGAEGVRLLRDLATAMHDNE